MEVAEPAGGVPVGWTSGSAGGAAGGTKKKKKQQDGGREEVSGNEEVVFRMVAHDICWMFCWGRACSMEWTILVLQDVARPPGAATSSFFLKTKKSGNCNKTVPLQSYQITSVEGLQRPP